MQRYTIKYKTMQLQKTIYLILILLSSSLFGNSQTNHEKINNISQYTVTDTFYANYGAVTIPNNQRKIYIFEQPNKKREMMATGDSIRLEHYRVLYKISYAPVVQDQSISKNSDIYLASANSVPTLQHAPAKIVQEQKETITIHTLDGGVKLNKTVPTK